MHIESLLCVESTDVRIVGIWGMGGTGKTTIADFLFKKLSSQFQGCAFVENVRERWTNHKKYELRNQLFRGILEDQMLCIEICSIRSTFIESRLKRRKVLIVLDDVSDFQQMNYLVEEKDWFGSGSRIIVTTRKKDVLPKENVGLHEVKPLNDDEALHLFCLKAFQQDSPKHEFKDLCKMVLDYARGNPLAIAVLGLLLHTKNQEEWRNTLQKLKKVPNAHIHGILRLSYDELNYQEKEIFLDIACFLKGERKGHIIDLLNGHSLFINDDLKSLHDKSLITILESEHVCMHDLIQEMGEHIVREKFIKQSEKWSRLWDPEDIYHALKCETVNGHSIETISLNMSQIKEVQISPDTFVRMPKLRLLNFYMPPNQLYGSNSPKYPYKCNVDVPKGLECLPDHLRYLRWDRFPLKAFPSSFRAEMLVEIYLKDSPIKKLWDGDQDIANLKILHLKGCHDLLDLPCLKKAAKLEEINILSCRSLKKLWDGDRDVANLKKLCLEGFHDLLELPCLKKATKLEIIDIDSCRSLLHVPSYILSLDSLLELHLRKCTGLRCIRSDKPSKSLQVLNLYGCSNLMEFSFASESLRELYLSGTAIEELPISIGQLINLFRLGLSGCQQLKKFSPIPHTPRFIKHLYFGRCSKLSELPENLSHLSALEVLNLSESAIETLPASIKLLCHLEYLDVSYCKRLRSLPELPPSLWKLEARGCISLETMASIEPEPRALMKNCLLGQKSLLPIQNQKPKASIYSISCLGKFDFTDCTKLDENACKTILDDAIMKIKYAAYGSSMEEASINLYHQLYQCSKVSDLALFGYAYRIFRFKYIANGYSDSTRIEHEEFNDIIANFNGISGGDLRPLVLALELNKEENTNVHASMQRICMQQGFPIPIFRYDTKRWGICVNVRLPRSRVPGWIRYRTTQNPFIITIQLPPSSHLLGFAFCFVFKKCVFPKDGYINCECSMEDAEGNKTSESYGALFSLINFISDFVCLSYRGRTFTRILKKLKEIRVIDQCSTFNPRLSFQFSFASYSAQSIDVLKDCDGLKECGVWPIYASDLEYDNPIESVELREQPKRNKLKEKKRNLLLWNCRWQALIMRMKMSKRKQVNLSSSCRTKGRRSKILDEQQQLPPREKSKRSQHSDDLEGCSINGIEKQDEPQPLHQKKKLKKRKRNAEK